MVEDVAQFSVRGGILDIYSFGMAEPVRAEFWGDEIVELRQFDLAHAAVHARRCRTPSCCPSTAPALATPRRAPSAPPLLALCRPTR